MQFQVTFYEYHGPKNVIGKDLSGSTHDTLTVNFKEGWTLSNPTIILTPSQVTDVKNCNYAWIEGTGRYYYISPEKNYLTGGMVELSLHVDVLKSFRTTIYDTDLLIERTSYSEWKSPYLNDTGLFPTAKRDLIVKQFGATMIEPTSAFVLHTSGVGGSNT